MTKKNKKFHPEASRRVYVAISGGVDSSVAAACLKEQGYSVVGVYMKTWSPEDQPCPWKEDRQDAMRVCANLNIPFKTWDFTDAYKEKVVNYMINDYSAGRTPNPDVMCNKEIKFGLFFNRAIEEGADLIATGHYARVKNAKLLKAKDKNKDQSYFLWALNKSHLEKTLFPIGEFKDKLEVREYAKKRGLATATKKDSQGVCFIGPINVTQFLKERIPASPGPVVSVTGKKLGEHYGLPFYTIGQRQGIGVGGTGPYYVARKEAKTNTLVVAPPAREEVLQSSLFTVESLNFIEEEPQKSLDLEISTRYRQEPVKGVLAKDSNGKWAVKLEKPMRAITEGQSAVFYSGKELIGGGIISKVK